MTPDEWARFRQDFVTGGDLARLMGQTRSSWLSRHLKFQGVEPVGGPGIDAAKLALFRRSDCTDQVCDAVRLLQAGRPGTPQEKHRRAFARVPDVAATVGARWGAKFTRVNNRFTDVAGGRTLQVVSGRRPDLTGVYQFSVSGASATRLRGMADVWVALVPSGGEHFLLLPFTSIRWRGDDRQSRYTTVRFDRNDRPTEMTEWTVQIAAVDE